MVGDRIRVLRLTPSDDVSILGQEGYISRFSVLSLLPMPKAVIYVSFPGVKLNKKNPNVRPDGTYVLYRYQVVNLDERLRRLVRRDS